ncbi:MAG TPA: hypothetical protein DCR07_05530, partial [Lactococcus sp.]|nr:hypothetical protein [Lactococcus sp.]
MARYDVTPELAATIRAVRTQNHVASKSVAEHIGKSQSYMSKLEKGDIKTIEEAELTSIFCFIFGSDKGFQDFLDSSLGTIFNTLELRFSDKEIAEQIWFDNYDTVLRMIPIPEAMIDNLYERMSILNLSAEALCIKINSNEGISPKVQNTDSYPFNEWQPFVCNHQIEFRFIKMNIDSTDIREILNKTKTETNYVTMLSIAYYIMKIECYGERIQLSEEEDSLLMRKASDYLNSYKFFSIYEKNRLLKQTQSGSEQEDLLSSFDKENSALINEILAAFKVFSELNIVRMNEYLSVLVENLKWDNSFMMKLMSTPFHDIKGTSFALKK